jgi:hypothetical protein
MTTLGELSIEDQRRLVYAPLWVFRAVANAEEPAGTAQFRTLVERLDGSAAVLGQSLAGHVFTTLRDNIDVLWAAFHVDSREPQEGLREVAGLLERLPPGEAETLRVALVELADAVADASRWVGAAPISDPERIAIHDVASWLEVRGTDAPT